MEDSNKIIITPLSLDQNEKEEKKEEQIEFRVKDKLGSGAYGLAIFMNRQKTIFNMLLN